MRPKGEIVARAGGFFLFLFLFFGSLGAKDYQSKCWLDLVRLGERFPDQVLPLFKNFNKVLEHNPEAFDQTLQHIHGGDASKKGYFFEILASILEGMNYVRNTFGIEPQSFRFFNPTEDTGDVISQYGFDIGDEAHFFSVKMIKI